MYTRILVPLDGSPLAENALEVAVGLARLTGAELLLFRALTLPNYSFLPGAFPGNLRELLDGERDAAQNYLDGLADAARQEGLRATTILAEGQPAKSILEAAEQHHVDLVVLSSHGQSGRLERWVYGSVAERVLRRCRSQVLLVRADPKSKNKPAAKTSQAAEV